MPKYRASRSDIRALMPRFPFTIPETWLGGTRRARASALIDNPSGAMKSSRRISPGCTGSSLIFFSAISVLLNDSQSVPRLAHPRLPGESKSGIGRSRECCIAPPGLPSTPRSGCWAELTDRRASRPGSANEASLKATRAIAAQRRDASRWNNNSVSRS